jgi:hypothetical protein
MPDNPVSAMLTVRGKRFACEHCGANVFTRAGENFACNGCGTEYGPRASALPLARVSRVYSFTRDQLIDAFTRLKLYPGRDPATIPMSAHFYFSAESMADALIEALEDGSHDK